MRITIFKFFVLLPLISLSQIINNSYNCLNINSSSKISSMGGELFSIIDKDVSLASQVPSLLNPKMDNQISFNFIDYVSDINFISFHSARLLPEGFMMFFGVDAFNYGIFDSYDESGNYINQFKANQQIFTLGSSKAISDRILLGTNIRFLNSKLEDYYSLSISSNISITYDSENNFSSTILIKNIGRPIIRYTSITEDLPLEVQLGFSKTLEHLPFKYSLVIHNLNKYDISNDYNLNAIYDPSSNSLLYEDETVSKKILRHIIIGGELNPFNKALYFRGGFNFQKREDLRLSNSFNMSGFSFGLGLNLKEFQINYSRNIYHVSSMVNSFSIITNLSNFMF